MDVDHLRQHFDRNAESFDMLYHPCRQSPLRRWFNFQFRSDITGRYLATLEHVEAVAPQSVLDVGCGPGHYLAALCERGVPRLVGIDISPTMLQLALQNSTVVAHPSLDLVQADFGAWESDERFDMVMAIGFFDYQSDPGKCLKKMKGHARKSVIATFPSRHWLRTPLRRIRRGLQGTHVYFYNVHGIRELAQGAGFRGCDITMLPGAGMNLVANFIV